MSYAVSSALQVTIYRRLIRDAQLTALVGAAIHDTVPAGDVPGTYVSLGPEEVRDRSDASGGGAEHLITISVVTDAAGFRRAKDIAGAVSEALVNASLVPEPGYACLSAL